MGQKVVLPMCTQRHPDCLDCRNWKSYSKELTLSALK